MAKHVKKIQKINQSGMVSIVVTLMFVVVAALVVLGMTQIAQRNNRQALDRQLGMQAQYAAETGINDARDAIYESYQSGQTIQSQNSCTGTYTKNNGQIGADTDVRYTCLMVNPNVSSLLYDNVSPGSSIVFPLNASSGNLESIDITWQSADGTGTQQLSGCPVGSDLPVISGYRSQNCSFGMLMLELVPNTVTALQTAQVANENTLMIVAAPSTNSAAATIPNINYTTATTNGNRHKATATSSPVQGRRVVPRCQNNVCTIRISGLNFSGAFVRARMQYVASANLQVSYASAVAAGKTLRDAQVLVDATGRAQDVQRRLQVRLPLSSTYGDADELSLSDFAIQSTNSICKRFSVAPYVNANNPGYFLNDASTCN